MEQQVLIDPRHDALLLVGVQTAYMDWHESGGRTILAGGLPTGRAHEILPSVIALAEQFPPECRWASIASHPPHHASFASSYLGGEAGQVLTPEAVRAWRQRHIMHPDRMSVAELLRYLQMHPAHGQVLYPEHAVEGSEEAELHPALRDLAFHLVHLTGYDQVRDLGSAFRDALGTDYGITAQMRERGVERLFIAGIDAHDGITRKSAEDASLRGFKTFIVFDATYFSGEPEDTMAAMQSMKNCNVKELHSTELEFPAPAAG